MREMRKVKPGVGLIVVFLLVAILHSTTAFYDYHSTDQFGAHLRSRQLQELVDIPYQSIATSIVSQLQWFASLRNLLPRFGPNFMPISSTFNPTNFNYLFSIGFWAVPGICLGLIFLICGIFFCAARCCCNCCGTNYITRGMDDDDENDINNSKDVVPKRDPILTSNPYKGAALKCPKLWVFLSSTLIACSVVLAVIFSFEVTIGFRQTANTVTGTTTAMVNDAYDITDVLELYFTSLPADAESQISSVSVVESTADEIAVIGASLNSVVLQIDRYRAVATYALMALASFLALFALLSCVCNCHYISFFVGIMTFPAMLLAWIGFGGHLAVSMLLSDACVQVNSFVSSNGASSTSAAALSSVMSCVDNSTLAGVDNITAIMLQQELATLHTQVDNTLGVNITILLSNYTQVPIQFPTLTSTNPAIAATLNALYNFSAASNASARLASCSNVVGGFQQTQSSVCGLILGGSDMIMVAFLVQGAMYIPLMGCTILGFKRFRDYSPHKPNAANIRRRMVQQQQAHYAERGIPMQPVHTRDSYPSDFADAYYQQPIVPSMTPQRGRRKRHS